MQKNLNMIINKQTNKLNDYYFYYIININKHKLIILLSQLIIKFRKEHNKMSSNQSTNN